MLKLVGARLGQVGGGGIAYRYGISLQAVQAANIMLELPETAGLPLSGWMP